MTDVLLEARQLSKSYPRYAGLWRHRVGTIPVLQDINWSLGAGERVGLVGASGCGKTTLARLLVGLLQPTAGEVAIKGESLDRWRGDRRLQMRRIVQYIFQDPMNSLNPRMTTGEILEEPLLIHRLATHRTARWKRIHELLSAVQLPQTYAQRLPRELSGGERQRVGIARALAVEPAALICDEPIASLDISVGVQILDLLRQLSTQRGMALLFISHDLRALAALCDRVTIMHEGRFIETGPTAQILTQPHQVHTQQLIRAAVLDLDAVS